MYKRERERERERERAISQATWCLPSLRWTRTRFSLAWLREGKSAREYKGEGTVAAGDIDIYIIALCAATLFEWYYRWSYKVYCRRVDRFIQPQLIRAYNDDCR